MSATWNLPENRYFDPDPAVQQAALEIFAEIEKLPIVSPHGHVDPRLFADPQASFGSPAELLIIPDHYVFRMLYSQGVPLESLGVPRQDGGPVESDHRKIWQRFAEHFHLFRGTPSGMWLAYEFNFILGVDEILDERTPNESTTRSPNGWPRRSSARGRSSSASTSKCWPPPMPPPTRSRRMRPCAIRAGRGASSPPSARTRW